MAARKGGWLTEHAIRCGQKEVWSAYSGDRRSVVTLSFSDGQLLVSTMHQVGDTVERTTRVAPNLDTARGMFSRAIRRVVKVPA